MRVGGVSVSGPAEEVLVLPRATSEDIVFRAVAVLDMSEFESRVPAPKPKAKLVKGGKWEKSLDDPEYMKQVGQFGAIRFAYMMIKSLEPSDIEWETVDMAKPSTWTNYEVDLKNAGFSETECSRIINCVASANALDELKLQKARESFLRGLAKASEKSSGQDTEQESTPSGDPATDLASDHQE